MHFSKSKYIKVQIFWPFFYLSSKDSFVKWWDLDTQHCFKTMVGHRSEVSRIILIKVLSYFWAVYMAGILPCNWSCE